jgi:hypothetical protein
MSSIETKMPVTLEQVLELLKEFREETKAQNEQLTLRLESILIKAPTKPKVEKPKPEKKAVNVKKPSSTSSTTPPTQVEYSNTMYWWIGMFATEDKSVATLYTAEEVKAAETNAEDVKEKTEGYDRRRAIAVYMWRQFSKSKKTVELKNAFKAWSELHKKKPEPEVPSAGEVAE